jgi:hypothetical protein
MIRRIISLRIPGQGGWPVDDGETLDVVAPEALVMQRAAGLPASRILAWLTPFEDLVVAPDRLPEMIAEIRAAVGAGPTLSEVRAVERVAGFLQRAHAQGLYVRVQDSN